MAATPATIEPCFDVDRLSYEIFTILESKFLFGYDDSKLFVADEPLTETPPKKTHAPPEVSTSKVRILSIDGVSDCLLAAAYLAYIESLLRSQSGDPAARISDYFDVVAGSGEGGAIAAMLFARADDGRSLFSAEAALNFLSKNGPPCAVSRKGIRGMFQRSRREAFRRIFGEMTLRDTLKPVLIPCFDLSSGAPFLFSRADAVKADGFDFRIREICNATCTGAKAIKLNSIDGRTRLVAVGGGLAMSNPTAAAITHVLHNKQEFPSAIGIEDLLVLSIAGNDGDLAVSSSPSAADVLRIAGSGMADTVDQAIALAFSRNTAINSCYLRLQVQGRKATIRRSNLDAKKMMESAGELLGQRNIESVLFHGKRLSNETNAGKLDRFAGELIKEHHKRANSAVSAVVVRATPEHHWPENLVLPQPDVTHLSGGSNPNRTSHRNVSPFS